MVGLRLRSVSDRLDKIAKRAKENAATYAKLEKNGAAPELSTEEIRDGDVALNNLLSCIAEMGEKHNSHVGVSYAGQDADGKLCVPWELIGKYRYTHRSLFLGRDGGKLIEDKHYILLVLKATQLMDKTTLLILLKSHYKAAKNKDKMLLVTSPTHRPTTQPSSHTTEKGGIAAVQNGGFLTTEAPGTYKEGGVSKVCPDACTHVSALMGSVAALEKDIIRFNSDATACFLKESKRMLPSLALDDDKYGVAGSNMSLKTIIEGGSNKSRKAATVERKRVCIIKK